jgi:membrane-associated phospholipid phosphatase
MKRTIPLIIVFGCGIFMLISFFIPLRWVQDTSQLLQTWYLGVIAFFVFIGVINIIRVNVNKIQRKLADWQYSIILLIFLFVMIGAGMFGGPEGGLFNYLFHNFQIPLSATMFSLLAFFVASAAFRAFRARNPEATLLLIAAVLVMVGRVPVGYWIWNGFPDLVEWLMQVPNTAAKRGIILGIDLGLISMALRVLLGIERSYMGGGKD